MSKFNTQIVQCSDSNCLECYQNNLICKKCDFSKSYFLIASSGKCQLVNAIKSFYRVEQDLDYRADNTIKLNLNFYTSDKNEHVKLASGTPSDLFRCFVKATKSRQIEAKSCILSVDKHFKANLILTFNLERLQYYSKDNLLSLSPGNKLEIRLYSQNDEIQEQVYSDVRRRRLLSSASLKNFTSWPKSFDYYISDYQKSVNVEVVGDDSEDLSTPKFLGILIGFLITVGIYSGESFSVIFSLCGWDNNYKLLKFAAVLRFLERLRFINLTFGTKLEHFWDKMAFMIYPIGSSSKSVPESFWENKQGFTGKIAFYQLKFGYDIYFMIKLALFWTCFVIVKILEGYFNYLWVRKKVNEKTLKRLCYFRQIYFPLFHIVVLDSMFYGSFTLLHFS